MQVPEFKPKETLAWLSAWLKNEDWKPYVKPTAFELGAEL